MSSKEYTKNIELDATVFEEISLISSDLDDFDTEQELIEYVLLRFAESFDTDTILSETTSQTSESKTDRNDKSEIDQTDEPEEDVQERLQQLGYIE
jgi:Trk K+ transport system NAD-binding subunit